jgi:hypothetical protein
MLTAQQEQLGKFGHWRAAYLKKLKKRKLSATDILAD